MGKSVRVELREGIPDDPKSRARAPSTEHRAQCGGWTEQRNNIGLHFAHHFAPGEARRDTRDESLRRPVSTLLSTVKVPLWEVLGGLDGTGFAIPFHSFPLHPFALSAEPHPSAPRLTISQREVELASPVPSPHASPRPSWLPSLYCRSAVCTSMLPWRCGTRSNNVMTANGHRSSPRARSRNLPVYCTVELATCPILSRPVAKRESVCVQRPG
jgi:hypothetical protein